jgi:hypothetical protein
MDPHGAAMENAMLSVRFVTVSAVILLFWGLAADRAAAQTASTETPGKPMQILQIVEKPAKAMKPHAQMRSGGSHKIHHYARAESKRPHLPVQTAAAPADSVSPPINSAPPIDVAAAEPVPQLAPTPSDPTPGELVIGSQTVKVASPDAVNDIDLAAKDPNPQPSTEAPSATTSTPAATTAAANALPSSDGAEPMPKSDSTNAAPAPSSPGSPGSPVGSTSWLLQVFAALGGAVAAGSVAWFLIGSTPQRTYG